MLRKRLSSAIFVHSRHERQENGREFHLDFPYKIHMAVHENSLKEKENVEEENYF